MPCERITNVMHKISGDFLLLAGGNAKTELCKLITMRTMGLQGVDDS